MTVSVRKEVLAVALDCGVQKLDRALRAGQFPEADARDPSTTKPADAWTFATLHRHDPALAERCRAIQAFLENLPSAA